MAGFPLFLSIVLGQEFKYRIYVYIPRVLFPPLGSWLGYKWFVSIVRVPHLLIKEKDLLESNNNFNTTAKYMSHPLFYIFTIVATLCLAMINYFLNKEVDMQLVENWILLIGSSIWWYFIIRTLQMAILVFWDYRHFLYTTKLFKRLNLFDYENAFGLKPLIEHTYSFLLLYILIIGAYLFYYQVFLNIDPNIKKWLSFAVWSIYFFFPIYGYLTTLWPASKIVHKRKIELMNELSEKMNKCYKSEDYKNLVFYQSQYDRLKSLQLPKYPFALNRLLQRFGLQIFISFLNFVISTFYKDLIKEQIEMITKTVKEIIL